MKDWKNDVASGGDPVSRNTEARKILYDMGLGQCHFEKINEEEFVANLLDRFEEYGERTVISSKQLFWLRDLKEKYL